MKQVRYALSSLSLPVLFVLTCPAVAVAAEAPEVNGLYAGIATGRLDFDFDGQDFRTSTGAIVRGSRLDIDVDSKVPLRISGGYNWGRWSLELAYENMLGSADMEIDNTRLEFDYANFTLGGVYRSSGSLYFLGKFGITVPDIEANTAGTRLNMGTSGYMGIGAGYRFTPATALEFDVTHTSEDMSTFMLGLRRRF